MKYTVSVLFSLLCLFQFSGGGAFVYCVGEDGHHGIEQRNHSHCEHDSSHDSGGPASPISLHTEHQHCFDFEINLNESYTFIPASIDLPDVPFALLPLDRLIDFEAPSRTSAVLTMPRGPPPLCVSSAYLLKTIVLRV